MRKKGRDKKYEKSEEEENKKWQGRERETRLPN